MFKNFSKEIIFLSIQEIIYSFNSRPKNMEKIALVLNNNIFILRQTMNKTLSKQLLSLLIMHN